MALPQKIQVNAITGASLPSTIDGDLNAGIKQPVIDILGIPDNTNISAAVMTVNASGLDSVNFRDSAANPGAAGKLQRNAADLLFHDGTSAKVVTLVSATQTLTGKTLTSPIIGTQMTLDQATGDYTLTWADPAAARAISIPDPGGTDVFVFRDMTQTLINKTLTSPVLGGTATGTYTLGGTPTIASPAISSPTLSGTAIGTYTLGGTPTVSSSINLTSGQIAFPASQAASAGANTLDDYEEGTWTPAVGGTATYTTQTGTYTKVGRLVTVQCRMVINAIGTGNTSLISGLPFTVRNVSSEGAVGFGTLAISVVYINVEALINSTTARIQSMTAAGTGVAANAVFGNSTVINFTVSYETD